MSSPKCKMTCSLVKENPSATCNSQCKNCFCQGQDTLRFEIPYIAAIKLWSPDMKTVIGTYWLSMPDSTNSPDVWFLDDISNKVLPKTRFKFVPVATTDTSPFLNAPFFFTTDPDGSGSYSPLNLVSSQQEYRHSKHYQVWSIAPSTPTTTWTLDHTTLGPSDQYSAYSLLALRPQLNCDGASTGSNPAKAFTGLSHLPDARNRWIFACGTNDSGATNFQILFYYVDGSNSVGAVPYCTSNADCGKNVCINHGCLPPAGGNEKPGISKNMQAIIVIGILIISLLVVGFIIYKATKGSKSSSNSTEQLIAGI